MALRSFEKYVGCGNDFILFDDRDESFPAHDAALIQRLCHRQLGIGADGVILLQEARRGAHFRMRIFNADGSEAEMCGNGLRCLVKFLNTLTVSRDSYQIETMERILAASYESALVRVEMGSPLNCQWSKEICFKDKTLKGHCLDTGVPHIVFFMEEIENFNLNEFGAFVRRHRLFEPKGTNVNIAQIATPQTIKIRTYERGVEGETLACGTGATAAALAAGYCYGLKGPIRVDTLSKETLVIDFHLEAGVFSKATMSGPAYYAYKGEINLDH